MALGKSAGGSKKKNLSRALRKKMGKANSSKGKHGAKNFRAGKAASKNPKMKLRAPKMASHAAKIASAHPHPWKAQLLANPDVRQMLINLAGEHTLHVISEFNTQMSDEEIAKRTKLRTSDVRVVLNKLHSCGLVSYSRSRDKNSGWYSYVWKMNNDKARSVIEHLQLDCNGASAGESARVDEAGGEYYSCPNCVENTTVPFEQASEAMFRCAQCGSSLAYAEGAKK